MKTSVKVAIGVAAVFCVFGFAFKWAQDRKIESIHENIASLIEKLRSDNASKAAEIDKRFGEFHASIESLFDLMIQNQREIDSIKNVMTIAEAIQDLPLTKDSQSQKSNPVSDDFSNAGSQTFDAFSEDRFDEIENHEENEGAFLDRANSIRNVKGVDFGRIERARREFFEAMDEAARKEFRRRVASEIERYHEFVFQNVPEEKRDFVKQALTPKAVETLHDMIKIRVLEAMRNNAH